MSAGSGGIPILVGRFTGFLGWIIELERAAAVSRDVVRSPRSTVMDGVFRVSSGWGSIALSQRELDSAHPNRRLAGSGGRGG